MHEASITGRHKAQSSSAGALLPQILIYCGKSHPALRPGSGAAFAIKLNGGEQLVVIQEVRDPAAAEDWPAILQKIRFDIAREHGIRAHSVLLIERNNVPKTSSGKIQRAESRSLFASGQLPVIAEWRATMI
jgi:acyl-CoA synthetase (AMP-forming)/AMP-acid ligase II